MALRKVEKQRKQRVSGKQGWIAKFVLEDMKANTGWLDC